MGTETEKMNRATKYGYGTGHIMNDMCASLWFTYLLLYYEKVINLGAVYAGIILLVGQIADGIATIVVGILSDRETNLRVCLNYGKRKSWHLIGTVGVLLSYPFLFAPAIGINRDVVQCTGNTECDDNKLMTIYYSVFSAIHNISWAFVQISHLAMIPEITSNERQRGFLTTMRNIGAVMSNIFVYSILWIMLGTGGSSDKIGPDNIETFRDVMLISVVGIGGLSSLIFHIIIKPSAESSEKVQHVENLSETAARPQSLKAQSSIASSLGGATTMGIFKWFLKPSFYLVAVVYMVTRLFVNVSNSYISLYIQSTLNLEPIFVAMVPLVMYIAGFIISVFLKFLTKRIGFKASFALSCPIGLGGCAWIWFGCREETAKYEIFPVAILLGGGGSAMLISSLTIVSSLIGNNTGILNYKMIILLKNYKIDRLTTLLFKFYQMSELSDQIIILQNQVHLFMEP